MQRVATSISFAVMLTTCVVAPDQPNANPIQAAVNQAAHVSSTQAPDESVTSGNVEPERPASMEEICATLAAAAAAHDLPLPFFARLIWQESRFRPEAVSHAGARGIAQFMPGTARERGLDDPHDPIQALRKSADFLGDLRDQFGNLGLAAAAYNGGPGRVQAWLKGRGGLPNETRQYVHIVTGVPADQWRARANADAVQTARIPARVPCPVLVAAAAHDGPVSVVEPARAATAAVLRATKSNDRKWSVVLASATSKSKAKVRSARVQQRLSSVLKGRKPKLVNRRVAGRGKARVSQVSIPQSDRVSAERLCAELRAEGANCTVVRAS